MFWGSNLVVMVVISVFLSEFVSSVGEFNVVKTLFLSLSHNFPFFADKR